MRGLIRYPIFAKVSIIGVTAPSSGVEEELNDLLRKACRRLEMDGYQGVRGETVRTQHKAKSAPARKRAEEFIEMRREERIDIIIPPWGGEQLP